MGDPKKPKKKYETPRHPWIKDVIESEKALAKEYGLKNKSEVWKMKSHLRKFKELSKKYSSARTNQEKKEMELFMDKVRRLGLLKGDQGMDDILGLDVKHVMERRLQTMVYRKNLANSMKQARQFIVHDHILVNGKKINIPSYIVKSDEEATIEFSVGSSLSREDHPEIANIAKKKEKKE